MDTRKQYEEVFWKKAWNKKEETMRAEIEAELAKKEAPVIDSKEEKTEVVEKAPEAKEKPVETKQTWFKVWDVVLDTKYNKEVVITEIILKAIPKIKNRWIAKT